MPRLVMVATCHTRGSNLRKYGPFVLLVVCPDARKILPVHCFRSAALGGRGVANAVSFEDCAQRLGLNIWRSRCARLFTVNATAAAVAADVVLIGGFSCNRLC